LRSPGGTVKFGIVRPEHGVRYELKLLRSSDRSGEYALRVAMTASEAEGTARIDVETGDVELGFPDHALARRACSMKPSGVVSLLTDFGLSDPYVGVMKAAVLRAFPGATLVDLCHELEAQDVSAAAFWLARSYRYFPAGTVHLAVVDPGVGSERAALAVLADGHAFVGPDNGLLASLAALPGAETFQLDAAALGLEPLSRTFHGRDLFAPVAGRLAAGLLERTSLGAPAHPLVPDPLPRLERLDGALLGQVVLVDRFGNALTNIDASHVSNNSVLQVLGCELSIVGTYREAPPGECVGLRGSFGVLEIALSDGSAAQALGLARGSRVILRP
jgi:S-adenosylmethionine hydrolase